MVCFPNILCLKQHVSYVPNAEIKRQGHRFKLMHLDRRHIREDQLYGRHDGLFAEEQLAHGRPCLVLSHDVIGHRDKVTAAAIER
jgi:hypothetical protein